MKKIILTFCILFFLFSGKAQSDIYHSFPSGSATWIETSSGYQCNMCCSDFQDSISGDTLIGAFVYHKIQRSGLRYASDQFGYCTSYVLAFYREAIGAIREDSVNKKVFFWSVAHPSDTLLYDFNLNVGDTLTDTYLNNYNSSSPADNNYVSSIDSVLMGNSYRKRYIISNSWSSNYVSIIEGMGNTFGLFGFLTPPFESGSILHCFIHNGIPVYSDSTTQCALITEIKKESSSSDFRVFPNPSKGIFSVRLAAYVSELEIMDLSGKEIYRSGIPDATAGNMQIDLSGKTKGIYFLHFKQNGRKIKTEKIVLIE